MAEKRVAVGSTGRTVAERVKQIREVQNLSYAELGRRLAAAGRPMPVLALYRIENLERRVDTDDLVALAQALGVSPVTLLMPHVTSVDESIEATGFEDAPARRFWRWLRAEEPVEDCDANTLAWFRLRSGPAYQTGARFGSESVSPEEFDQFWQKETDNGGN